MSSLQSWKGTSFLVSRTGSSRGPVPVQACASVQCDMGEGGKERLVRSSSSTSSWLSSDAERTKALLRKLEVALLPAQGRQGRDEMEMETVKEQEATRKVEEQVTMAE
eukprot:752151-Hanusia_phi.AAC.1